jgi:hypothetical protein
MDLGRMSRARVAVRAGLVVLALALVAALAGCGGPSTPVGSATSLTKKAMKSHKTKFTSIECVQPSADHYVCEALGSGASPGFYAWCSVPIDQGAIGDFDATTDCHWPALNVAPKISKPNNPVVTTGNRLGK